MTDWEIVTPASGTKPAQVRLKSTYTLKPGDVRVYEPGDVHAPYRAGPTRLIRVEGQDTTKIKRTPIVALEEA